MKAACSYHTQQPIREIIAITTTDVHPPLFYYYYARLAIDFGNSVASLRAFKAYV